MEPLRFDGRVALVTGGARGLGRAYATLLAERGARVLLVDRPSQHDELVSAVDLIRSQGGIAAAYSADLTERQGGLSSVEAALSTFSRLDVVVNNAGVLFSHAFDEYPYEDFEAIMSVHVRAPWQVTQAAWPSLVASGSGRVVNTVSRAAFFGERADVAYSAAKAAVYGFTRALALEGAEAGIKVNAVCPVAWTSMFESSRVLTDDQRRLMMEKFKTSLVAPVVALLAHEACPCSGEVIASVGGVVQRYLAVQTDGLVIDDEFTPEQLLEHFDTVANTALRPIEMTSYKASDPTLASADGVSARD